MVENLKSQMVTQGFQRSPNRAMLRAVGFGDDDFTKPIIGIANGHSTITPCNMGIGALAQRAETAVRSSGGMPQLFGTITISDGISMGTEGMKYSLVSRDVIADAIETVCMGQSLDGVLAIQLVILSLGVAQDYGFEVVKRGLFPYAGLGGVARTL